MTAARVRRAHGADARALVALCAEHASYERASFAADGKCDALRTALDACPPRLFAWLAERDGTAVGYASASFEYSTWDAREFLHMDCLYLRDDARGAGVGAALVDALVAHARAHGCAELQWQTPAWNARAIRFYSRLGAIGAGKIRFRQAVDRQS
ncbi:GNAT family N-acetyltransferase [Dokdonella sp.]|uniref:GNAT family N-acetyltransferase n=1 Tax=Dokdonella sp. TaxID=2291710 RepID=UPI002F4027A8